MKMKKYVSLLLILAFFNLEATAQDSSKKLTLDEAIASAVAGNAAVKLATLDEQIAKAKYKQTDAIYLPQAGISYTAFSTNNPLNAFGFKLQQQSITAADFNPALLNHPSATPDFTTKFEVQQPLLNMDMNYQRKGAAKQVEMYQLGTQRTKEYLAFETKKTYLQLQMLYDADKVLNEALTTAKAVYKSTNDHFKQGLIQKSDLLNAEVHVMSIETQLHNSQSNISDASDMLSLLMGKPAGVVYRVDPSAKSSNNTDSLQSNANRADFKAMQKGMEAYDMMIKASKMSNLPRVNAFGSWQLNDKSMLGFGANAYMVGVQLSWTVFNGNRTKNTIAQQSFEKDKLSRQLQQQKEEATFQVNHAKRQLSDASFAIKQQQLAAEQSAEALRVLQKRYEQGLVKTTDVLMAQTQLSQQQLGQIQAVYNYNMAAAYLQFLTISN
ncbi:MAG: TolC family protein [Chitinophagaceae bacterium]|nr:TolC family protein [Chitinophagaceae bacterium]